MTDMRFVRSLGIRRSARKAARAGDWRAAADAYRTLVRKGVATARDMIQLAHGLKEAGDAAAADAAYRAAAATFPRDSDAQLHLGLFLHSLGHHKEAANALARTLILDPSSAFVRAKLTELGVEEDASDAAILAGTMAGYDDPPKRHGLIARLILGWHLRSARHHARARRWDAAARNYRRLLALDPGDPRFLVQLGHILREKGDAIQAVAVYRNALIGVPRQPDIYLHLGHALKALGRHESALQAYLTAARLQPGLPPAMAELNGMGWSEIDLCDTNEGRHMLKSDRLALPDGLTRRQRSIWKLLATHVENGN